MQISDVSELDPHSINGLNLYAYANNNPIRVAYVNFSVGVIINSLAIDEIVVPCGGLINKGSKAINVYEVEKEIWEKKAKIWFFKNPFYYWNQDKIIKTLIEVINVSIEKNNEFFGIKIK